MKQWDIWTCDFADAGPHPAVVVSHPDRVARAPLVNVCRLLRRQGEG
jgi:mRNA-degrading endonuclease toxin of MazEF toxin-antitoxin module